MINHWAPPLFFPLTSVLLFRSTNVHSNFIQIQQPSAFSGWLSNRALPAWKAVFHWPPLATCQVQIVSGDPSQNHPRLISSAMKTKTTSRITTKWPLFTLPYISKRKLFFRLNEKITILALFHPSTQLNPHKPLWPIKPLFYLLMHSSLLQISFLAQ